MPSKATYHARARAVWTRARGPIPPGYETHHRNGDWTDNSIENLECLSATDHHRLKKRSPDAQRVAYLLRDLDPVRWRQFKARAAANNVTIKALFHAWIDTYARGR